MFHGHNFYSMSNSCAAYPKLYYSVKFKHFLSKGAWIKNNSDEYFCAVLEEMKANN
jgi:hypothetical protein